MYKTYKILDTNTNQKGIFTKKIVLNVGISDLQFQIIIKFPEHQMNFEP